MEILPRPHRCPLRILVPLDGSALAEHALPYARTLAGASTELLLLRVIPDVSRTPGAEAVNTLDSEEALRRGRRAALEDLVATTIELRDAGSAARAVASVAVGDPAEQIIRIARERDVDLIVMTSHGRGAVGRLAFGSVADRVARSSSVPVLITRPKDALPSPGLSPVQRLVVPLDGSDLSSQAVSVAETLAKAIGVPILVVSVIDPWMSIPPAVGHAFAASQQLYDDLVVAAENEIRPIIEGAVSRLRAEGCEVEYRLLRGPIAPAISAEIQPGDVVVMTSHGQTGVRRWLLGSVAEQLVREGPAPVLLVRAAQPLTVTVSPAVPVAAPVAAGG